MNLFAKSEMEKGSSSDLPLEEIKLPYIFTESLKILSLWKVLKW